MIKRENIRWFCPECGRVDPRHPDTLVKDLPRQHNRLGRIGNWLDKSEVKGCACKGVRIPQSFNEETKQWENK